MKKIGHRRNLLAYLRKADVQRYRELIRVLAFVVKIGQIKPSASRCGAFLFALKYDGVLLNN